MLMYIIKSSLYLSVLLLCYYVLFRKDKWFIFNRIYLLFALVFSLSVPLINISFPFISGVIDQSHLQFVNEGLITLQKSSGTLALNTGEPQSKLPSLYSIGYLLYLFGTILMTFRYFKNLWAIRRLKAISERYTSGATNLYLVPMKSGPFCFGKFIFLNKDDYHNQKIDADIIGHEQVHARQFHTLDILLIEFVLIVYWFNPLVWCHRWLIKANHEYCVDNHLLRNNQDMETYINKLAGFTGQLKYPLQASGFDYSLIKNRIIMMRQMKSSRSNFIQKLSISIITLMFSMAVDSMGGSPPSFNDTVDPYIFTVVVDVGHGGVDTGASNANILEKDLVLAISKSMSEINIDPSIKIIFTRNSDDSIPLKERAQLALTNQADLFVSLHINSNDNNRRVSGLEVYYSEQNIKSNQSKDYGEMFANNIKMIGNSPPSIKKANLLVLAEASCPAVLLSMGFITNPLDLKFLSSRENQRILAKQIIDTLTNISKK